MSVGAPVGLDGREHGVTAFVDEVHAVLVHGGDEAGAIAEVVLGGVVVALAGVLADVAERDGLDAPLGEQPLGGLDERDRG